jgi:hypothetical protein
MVGLITILLNVRTLSVVVVFCHLDYCSKFFEKSSEVLREELEVLREELDDLLPKIIEFWIKKVLLYYPGHLSPTSSRLLCLSHPLYP